MIAQMLSLGLGLVRRIGGLLLGGVILWQVAEHAGATRGQAIVHVATPGVDVLVDDARYSIEEAWGPPIVCDLCPGRHRLRMLRSGRLVYEEEFTIAAGGDVVLVAGERRASRAVPSQRSTSPGGMSSTIIGRGIAGAQKP